MNYDLRPCISGDKGAWDAFVTRFAPVLYAAVGRTLRARVTRIEQDEVEDVVQNVFVRLIARDYHLLKSFDPSRASITTWLTIVARSVAIDHLRRRRPAAAEVDVESLQIAEPDRPGVEPIELPPGLLTSRQQIVLRMLFDRGMSVAEAATALGVDAQTVRSTKHKAISRLREHLGRP